MIRSFTATPNTRNSLRIVLLGAASFLVFVGLNSGARSQAIPVSCSVDTSNDFACGAHGLASATGGFATAIGGELPIAVARATAVGAGATALSVGTTAIGSDAIADGASGTATAVGFAANAGFFAIGATQGANPRAMAIGANAQAGATK